MVAKVLKDEREENCIAWTTTNIDVTDFLKPDESPNRLKLTLKSILPDLSRFRHSGYKIQPFDRHDP